MSIHWILLLWGIPAFVFCQGNQIGIGLIELRAEGGRDQGAYGKVHRGIEKIAAGRTQRAHCFGAGRFLFLLL